jgi:hypothetical protein
MRRITYLIACLTLITISLSACKKTEDDPTPITTKQKFVGTWKTTQVKVTIAGVTVTSTDPCFLDDKIIFNESGSYKKTVGEQKCDADDEDIDGSWELKNDEVNFSATIGDLQVSENFKLLSDNTMQNTATVVTTTNGTSSTIETVTLLEKE